MKRTTYLYGFAMILIIWFLIAWIMPMTYLPNPIKVLNYMASHPATLMGHLLVSLLRIMIAIFLTTLVGSLVGLLTGSVKWVDQVLSPLLYTFYPVPKIAFLPLLMLFLGLGNASKVMLVFLILFFQVAINLRDGVKQIPDSYYRHIRSLGGRGLASWIHVVIPYTLPALFTSLRMSVGTSISVLFFAENYATQAGIGFFIMDAWLKLNYVAMYSGILVISLLGIGLFLLLDLVEQWLCPWRH